MSNTWFSSDLHFNHKSMVDNSETGEPGWRNFRTLEEMNETIIERWNSRVSPEDFCIILGDVCMGKRDESLLLAARLNGMKYLIPGNHDYCWDGNIIVGGSHEEKHRNKVKLWTSKYIDVGGFQEILPSSIELFLPKGAPVCSVDVCHFPAIGDREDDDRYPEHHPPVSKTFNIHGHTHMNYTLHHGNQIHVGVDGWDFYPVNLEEICTLMTVANV